MSKPTPGPWEHNGNTVQSVGRHYSSTLIATTSMAPHFEQAEANARLISSAPEMYDALRDVFEYLDAIPESAAGGDDDAVNLARKCRSVIAKAEGK